MASAGTVIAGLDLALRLSDLALAILQDARTVQSATRNASAEGRELSDAELDAFEALVDARSAELQQLAEERTSRLGLPAAHSSDPAEA